MNEQKAMGLIVQLTRGLLRHGAAETQAQLGDRSVYIGMSDIGSGVECLRRAVARKVMGNESASVDQLLNWYQAGEFDSILQVLNRQLILQRGHWFEQGVENALLANTGNLLTQLEIAVEIDGVPIKGHLDFVLVADGPKPVVRVLELKSTGHLPESLYTAYEVQLYGQIGLLTRFWGQPVFSLKTKEGQILFEKLTFPQLVKSAFSLDFPENVEAVDLEGWVLALTMNEAKPFGPYIYSEAMTELSLQTACKIHAEAEAVRDGQIELNDLSSCDGFHALCEFCPFQSKCDKFKTVDLEDEAYAELLAELADLKQKRQEIDESVNNREKLLRQFYAQTGVDGLWLQSGEFRFRCLNMSGRETLDREVIESLLAKTIGADEAAAIIDQAKKLGKPYQRLYVSKV